MKERSIDFGDHNATVTQFTVLGDDEQTVEAIIVRLKIASPRSMLFRARSYALTGDEAIALGSALLAHGLDCQDRNEELEHEAMTSTDQSFDSPARHQQIQRDLQGPAAGDPPTFSTPTTDLARDIPGAPATRLRIVETDVPPAPPLEGGVADESTPIVYILCPRCATRRRTPPTATAPCSCGYPATSRNSPASSRPPA